MKYTDPNKAGFTNLSIPERKVKWEQFFKSCIGDGGCWVSKILYNRDGDKKLIDDASKKFGFVKKYELENIWFMEVLK